MSRECNVSDRFFQRLISGVLPCLLLLGCSAVPMSPGRVLAQDAAPSSASGPTRDSDAEPVVQSQMDSQLMFELMIAELAGRRGRLDVAMAGYLRAAQHTDDPRVSERATRLALYGQQWPEAEEAARRWQSLEPQAVAAREMLAQALMQQGQTDDAVALYRELLQESEQPDAILQQVQATLQGSEQPEQALELMQALQQSVPNSAEAHLGVARMQLLNNDPEAALISIDAARQIEPDDSEIMLFRTQVMMSLGRADQAFADVQLLLDEHPERSLLRLGLAQLQIEAGRFDSVGTHLDALYEDADGNPDTLLTISMLALEARRMERARTYLGSLLDSGGYPDQANFYLARINDQQQDPEAARAHYEAVGEGELLVPAQIRLAELQASAGELQAGRERLQQLAAEHADSTDLQIQLLSAESRMLQNADKAAEAVEVLSQGLESWPEDTDLLYSRALAADAAGDAALLVSDLQKLIEIEPDNAHALNALGYHYADSNIELDAAEQLLVKANRLLPNDPAIMDSLGWLHYRQGRFEPAIALLREAYALYPDPEIAAHLGEVLWLNGNEQEAREFVDEALAASPEDDRLLQVRKKYIE